MLRWEKEFLATHLKHPLPAGIIRLGEGDEDVFAVTEQILNANLFLKMDTPLSTIDRTIEDYTRMDNEQLYNFREVRKYIKLLRSLGVILLVLSLVRISLLYNPLLRPDWCQ